MTVKSRALPFLEAPKKLDGKIPGDAGFDPLYISDNMNLDYLRASEIKHCRVAMLAALGYITQEFFHLPGDVFNEKHALAAIHKVPIEGWIQIILFISLVEIATFRTTFSFDREPGDFGFDPLGLAKSPQLRRRYQESEIRNGRLAMIAVIGFIVQELVTGKSVVEQLQSLNLF
ncbi:Fucoxanthin-chlorophyll a-c binding protein, chloroplastic [Galdieria sulphuraria]|nr:Fucoxanthin-chlorophyll a-c binding protein, chloroplastic [Galdieria sulphuraria]